MNPEPFEPGPKPGDRDTTFFDHPMLDGLVRALATTVMELSVTRERLDRMERYLQAHHGLKPGALDDGGQDLDAQKATARRQTKLVDDVFSPLAAGLTPPK